MISEAGKKLLERLDMAEENFTSVKRLVKFNPIQEHMGGGMKMRFKRLIYYRGEYIKHILRRLYGRLMFIFPESDTPVTTFWGRELFLPSRDVDAQNLSTFGTFDSGEAPLVRFLIKELKENDVFYDVGANYGFYTALAQEIITTGEIHSFEPSDFVFRRLQQVQSYRKNTFINKIALSDFFGKINFFDCASNDSSGKSTTVSKVAHEHRHQYKTTEVTSSTLDEYCKNHKLPTVIKIDVEGAESKVLMGGMHTFKRNCPTIALELWSGEELSKFSFQTLEILEDFGYDPFFINSEGLLESTTFLHLTNFLKTPQQEINFVFKKTCSKSIT